MTRRRLASITAPAAILLFALARPDPQDDALDPVKVASNTHKIALQNAFVRILDVHIPPGSIEPRHRHPQGLKRLLHRLGR